MKSFLKVFLVYYIIFEVVVRLALVFTKDYQFFKPRYSALSSSIEQVNSMQSTDYNVLVLGGSAISNELPGKVGQQLEDSLKKTISKARVIDLGMPARTSLDNRYVLELSDASALKNAQEIYYYESLNDSRYNCIPVEHFKEDYSHAHWYQELGLMHSHPEMNITIIPYVIHLFMERLKERTGSSLMLTDELDVNPEFMDLGAAIKTDVTFKQNIEAILSLFDLKNTKTTLLEYNLYIPKQMYEKENLGFFKEEKYFSAKGPRTTSGAWGYPWNAEKAVNIHNEILKNVAETSDASYLQMSQSLERIEQEEYFDICHFTEEGGSYFVHQLLVQRDSLLTGNKLSVE